MNTIRYQQPPKRPNGRVSTIGPTPIATVEIEYRYTPAIVDRGFRVTIDDDVLAIGPIGDKPYRIGLHELVELLGTAYTSIELGDTKPPF